MKQSYYTTCENCEATAGVETILEGEGELQGDYLVTLPCPVCGQVFEYEDWAQEEEEE